MSYVLSEKDNWDTFAVINEKSDVKSEHRAIFHAIKREASCTDIVIYDGLSLERLQGIDWGEQITVKVNCIDADGDEIMSQWDSWITIKRVISY